MNYINLAGGSSMRLYPITKGVFRWKGSIHHEPFRRKVSACSRIFLQECLFRSGLCVKCYREMKI